MPIPTLRPLGFGEILDGAFSLYRQNFATFVMTAMVASLGLLAGGLVYAVALGGYLRAGGNPATAAAAIAGPFLLYIVLSALATLVSWGALTRQAAQAFTGAPVSVPDGLKAGLRALFPMMGAGILAGFAIGAVALAMGILGGIFAAVLGMIGALMVGITLLVLVMLVITIFAGVAPAVVVERKGPLSALTRSFDLVSGALGRTMGLVVVSVLIAYMPLIAVVFVAGSTGVMANPAAAAASPGALIAQQVLTWIAGVLTTPFMVSVFVLTYFDRRVRTEALDVQVMTDSLAPAAQ
jgi:exosortase/archaeosortase